MKISAGLLLYRLNTVPEVFLVHPGGPFWKNKDLGVWSIPKGESSLGENPLDCAKREFKEETGQAIEGYFIPLDAITQKGGKIVQAWAVEGDIDAESLISNRISIPWPPRSGKLLEIPEVDKGAWFNLDEAQLKVIPAQAALIIQLQALLNKDD
ncbi:MAG: NUDIX domain-containing protein [Pedobacter sp.]|nr:MAG: NUDIX domain-containing protein [Pedobacter sp.]